MSKETKDVDNEKIIKIMKEVKAKIEAHKEFKAAYNKQLAFDFNMLNFFKVQENKTTEILAYFLNPKENHGQGDAFLKLFLSQFCEKSNYENSDLNNAFVKCEQSIKNKRLIDLYIDIDDFIVAIENKLWAEDRLNQLKDYAEYIKKIKNDNYLLLYLNPNGHEPNEISISKDDMSKLQDSKHFNIISYADDIDVLLKSWAGVCEAENVSYFIKQFQKYLRVKFVGNNTLNIRKGMKELIYNNKEESIEIAKTYNVIVNEKVKQINNIAKKLLEFQKEQNEKNPNIKIILKGPFPHEGNRVVKFKIEKDDNIMYIHLQQHNIFLYSSHYFDKCTFKGKEDKEKNIVSYTSNGEEYSFDKEKSLDKDISDNEVIKIFKKQVEKAIKLFDAYRKEENK